MSSRKAGFDDHQRSPNESLLENSAVKSDEPVPFSILIWNEVSIVIFNRFLQIVRSCLCDIFHVWKSEDKAARLHRIEALRQPLQLAWAAGKRFFSSAEVGKYSTAVQEGIDSLVDQLEHLTTVSDDPIVLCRQYLRLMEEYGFVEEDGGELGACLARLKFSVYPNGYAYSERVSISRYEPDRKLCETELSPSPISRAGYVVSLSHSSNLSPELNTAIQLVEPRKRRPQLDEYRIFSHPKKTATHGVEDLLVEEEHLYRNVQVLWHHLDAFGSLRGVSPFVRFTLYSTVDKQHQDFHNLCDLPSTAEEQQKRIQDLRDKMEAKKYAVDKTRALVREAAQRIGWFAISAQWRDQILCSLQDAEESDWYSLGEVLKGGGISRFPNYSQAVSVRQLLLGVIEKLDAHFKTSILSAEGVELGGAHVLVRDVFLPVLDGRTPTWPGEKGNFLKNGKKLQSFFVKWMEHHNRNAGTAIKRRKVEMTPLVVATVLLPSLLFSTQCVAELLEVCSAALESVHGIHSFTSRFLSSSWSTEEDILAHFLSEEPTNVAIASLVAIPKIYKDLVQGIQFSLNDTAFPIVLEAKQLFMEARSSYDGDLDLEYGYWKAVTAALDEDRQDDLLFLRVAEFSEEIASIPYRYYTEGILERALRVWPHEMAELIREENRLKELLDEKN